MTRRTLVLRRNGRVEQPREAERLLQRLSAQPGVEWVRVDTMPFCVSMRISPELADEAALRAMVLHDGVEVTGSEAALRVQARLGSLLPKAARALAAVL